VWGQVELEHRFSKQRLDRLGDKLTDLGLSDDEARVYLHLHMLGLSKVRRISEAARLERSKTYRVLDRLKSDGLVQETLENPARYEARDPDAVIDDKIGEQRDRIQHLETMREVLVPAMHSLADSPENVPAGCPSLRTVQGRESIYRNGARLVDDAENELLAMSTHPSAAQLAQLADIETKVDALVEAGVTARVLVETSMDSLSSLADHEDDAFAIRAVPTDKTIRFVLRDEEELMVVVQSDPSQQLKSDDDIALVTDARGLIQAYTALFDTWWTKAKRL